MQMPAGKYGQMAIKPQDWTSHREVRDAEKFQAELSKRTKQSHETFEPEIIDPFEQEQQQ
jgi:hypothetical protein